MHDPVLQTHPFAIASLPYSKQLSGIFSPNLHGTRKKKQPTNFSKV